MLQINPIPFLFLCLVVCTTAAPAGLPDVDWLLKDAYEEEFVPLSDVAVVTPIEVHHAMEEYARGNYRKTAEILEKLRCLNLPDGRLDFIAFALAECYRRLGCVDLARKEYQFVIKEFPQSDKTPFSYYRLLEFAVRDDDMEKVDNYYQLFKLRFARHQLFSSVNYLSAVLFYKRNQYEEAGAACARVPERSSRYYQAQFLLSLCYLQVGDYPKALLSLEIVRKQAPKGEMVYEAIILIGDCYYLEDNPEVARRYYQEVPKEAERYHYAEVKSARAIIDLGRHAEAAKRAKKFLKRNKNSQYYFEMASVLEQAYTKQGNEKGARGISSLIHRQIMDARLGFEIYDEIDKVTDMLRSWQEIEHQAIRKGNRNLQKTVADETERLQELQAHYYSLLQDVMPSAAKMETTIPYHAERRYMALLKAQMSLYDDTLGILGDELKGIKNSLGKVPSDTLLARRGDSISCRIDTIKGLRNKAGHEHDLVLRVCIGKDPDRREIDEELQAKFVDWAFIKYQEKKDELKAINLQISSRKRAVRKDVEGPGAKDTVKKAMNVPAKPKQKQYTEKDREREIRLIGEERVRLANHIETILEVYPRGKYAPQILFRLAELYFDAASDDFEKRLRTYEQRMAQGADTAGLLFPDYQLDSVITVYDRIIVDFPYSDVADAAYFYKALALQKLGREEEGNAVLLAMIKKYPESRFYVEANMNIGKYYFDHPRVGKGQGYTYAEEAYRRVLFFRDHPEYIPALYHLGWCYYMQDRYEEAIAVFKYLIEESNLDFDLARMEEKQAVNPLLRDEAIDYIAISFDSENRINDAIKFLELVGNVDYAALVLKRIGELREEDLDFTAAISVYRRLLSEYPHSRVTPETYVSLIRLYESNDQPDSSMQLREKFFSRFARGGEWQKKVRHQDSSYAQIVDSMAIINGLYVADAIYRKADSSMDRDAYARAAKSYERLVKNYSGEPRAAEALWNLAVILDTKLQDKPRAFERYIAFSRLEGMDAPRREQAALNAIAIAQSLLPPDSLLQKGTVDFAASKVVEAVENYTTLFPDGSSWGKVMLSLGAVYFNRHLFTSAEKKYEAIIARGPKHPSYFEALSLLGQCHYGEENWPAAITVFKKVWNESQDEAQKAAVQKLLLQSEFLNAKRFLAAKDYANAAKLFKSIDDYYPGSEYGDVALFNAAEAHEKLEQWEKACSRYYDLVKRYPGSKLAADALFNAAGNYEKVNKFNKAAAAYETIVAEYGSSDKAKDALFNVGFCYEKLGKPEKMADANERYSARYPEEKDVEAMLLRSAAFYVKANMRERAVSVYRSFIHRYPRNPKSIEAYFMIAKCDYDQGDTLNALLGFAQAEQHNLNSIKAGLDANNYFAAEAAYFTGRIKREKFLGIKLALPEEVLKRSLKEKSDLLAEAVKAFGRVVQYRSERMFEAAYRIGQLYEDLAMAWKDQERPSVDPIKMAVLDKDIFLLSSTLMQKSFSPYEKAIGIAKEFDSLGREQGEWIEKSKTSLITNYLYAGDLFKEAVSSMSSAPVPKEIRDKPLHFFQYEKQLEEALAPMREQLRDYYHAVLLRSDSIGVTGAQIDSCRTECVKAILKIGESYDHLASKILRNAKEVTKDLPQEEKEDLLFQLEDIVFELQDKALFAYEDGLKRIEKMKMMERRQAAEIIANLARLSPDKYGSAYFKQITVISNGTWIVRSDSSNGWCSAKPPASGWRLADTVRLPAIKGFPEMSPCFIRNNGSSATDLYVWKHIFLRGAPRGAGIFIACPCAYRLFVNGSLVLGDTAGGRNVSAIDSATGIISILQGGDNFVCAQVSCADSLQKGAAILLRVMIDTSQHFTSSVQLPPLLQGVSQEYAEKTVTDAANAAMAKQRHERRAGRQKADRTKDAAAEYAAKYRNRGELLMAIDNYRNRGLQLAAEIKKEDIAIMTLKKQHDSITGSIQRVKGEIDSIREKIQNMSRKKEQGSSDIQKKDQRKGKARDTVDAGAPPKQKLSDTEKGAMQKRASSVSDSFK
ncbi:MAG: tetratricopeptide repeat protein [Chitinispirillaceae bacterium]|nr:tetratricopeptide repeat protein [Chitinispirillaceae bacterium]